MLLSLFRRDFHASEKLNDDSFSWCSLLYGPRYFGLGIGSPDLYTLLGCSAFCFLEDLEEVWVRSEPSSFWGRPKARFILSRKGMVDVGTGHSVEDEEMKSL